MNRALPLWVWLWVWLWVCLVACGDVSSADAPGDPLFVVAGRFEEVGLPPPRGRYSSVLGWTSIGGGALIDCLAESSPLFCNPNADYQTTLVFEPADIRPQFPLRFEIDIVSLPDVTTTLDYRGAVLALGGVAIYDDGNLNGQLDFPGPGATAAVDRFAADSALTEVTTGIVFREGPVHPFWEFFRLSGCPSPPEGFSVFELGPGIFDCTVSASVDLRVRTADEEVSADALCTSQAVQFATFPRSRRPVSLPANSVSTCSDDGTTLTYYVDFGNFCDPFLVAELRLAGCDTDSECWDFTSAPPAWWPCARP